MLNCVNILTLISSPSLRERIKVRRFTLILTFSPQGRRETNLASGMV